MELCGSRKRRPWGGGDDLMDAGMLWTPWTYFCDNFAYTLHGEGTHGRDTLVKVFDQRIEEGYVK